MYFNLEALRAFHLYWREMEKEDRPGTLEDMSIMKEDAWRQDSAVIERIGQDQGQWTVSLVFSDPSRKSTFIIRPIRTCPTYKNAKMTAGYMRRVAAKDPRGTIEVNPGNYLLYLN